METTEDKEEKSRINEHPVQAEKMTTEEINLQTGIVIKNKAYQKIKQIKTPTIRNQRRKIKQIKTLTFGIREEKKKIKRQKITRLWETRK